MCCRLGDVPDDVFVTFTYIILLFHIIDCLYNVCDFECSHLTHRKPYRFIAKGQSTELSILLRTCIAIYY